MGKVKKTNKNTHQQHLPSAWILAVLLVIVLPLLHIKTIIDPVTYPRFTALAAGLLILVLLYFYVDKQNISLDGAIFRNGFIIVVLLFIFVSVVSLVFAVNPAEGLTDIFKWMMFLVLVVFASLIFKYTHQSKLLFLKALIINALLAVIIGISQYFNLTFQNTDPNALYEVKGLMAHKNQFSGALFLLLPFLSMAVFHFEKKWKSFAAVALAGVVLLIVLLQTRAVWIAIVISGFITTIFVLMANRNNKVLPWNRKKLKPLLVLGTVLLVSVIVVTIISSDRPPFEKVTNRIQTVFDPTFTSNEWRVEMWKATAELINEKPITGVGAGNWKVSIYPYYSKFLPSVFRHWRSPHNDYLWVASEKGIPGLVLYISMFVLLLYYGLKLLLKSQKTGKVAEISLTLFGITGFIVISLFSFPSERINHMVFLGLLAAYILAQPGIISSTEKKKKPKKAFFVIPISVVLFMAFLFGVMCIRTEINIAKAQTAYETKNWAPMMNYAEKGYFSLAPIEPKNSYPVVMYKGLASFHADRDYKKALEYFLQAHRQHPTSVSVLNNIGSAYGQTGQYEKSVEYFQKTLDIFPHYEHGLLNLAKAYYKMEDYTSAYQTVLACDPRSTTQDVEAVKLAIESKMNGE